MYLHGQENHEQNSLCPSLLTRNLDLLNPKVLSILIRKMQSPETKNEENHIPFTKEMISQTYYSAEEASHGNLTSIIVFEVSDQKIGIQYSTGKTNFLKPDSTASDLIRYEEAKKIALQALMQERNALGRNSSLAIQAVQKRIDTINGVDNKSHQRVSSQQRTTFKKITWPLFD